MGPHVADLPHEQRPLLGSYIRAGSPCLLLQSQDLDDPCVNLLHRGWIAECGFVAPRDDHRKEPATHLWKPCDDVVDPCGFVTPESAARVDEELGARTDGREISKKRGETLFRHVEELFPYRGIVRDRYR